MADDAAGGAAEPGKTGGQAAGTATGLDDGTAGTGAEAQADVGDILGIDDLGLALQALETVVQGGFQHTDGDIQTGAHFAAEVGGVYGFGAEDAVVAVPVLTFLKALDVAPVLVGGDVDHQRAVGDHVFPCGWSGSGQGGGTARKGAPQGRGCRAAGAFRYGPGLPVREGAGQGDLCYVAAPAARAAEASGTSGGASIRRKEAPQCACVCFSEAVPCGDGSG